MLSLSAVYVRRYSVCELLQKRSAMLHVYSPCTECDIMPPSSCCPRHPVHLSCLRLPDVSGPCQTVLRIQPPPAAGHGAQGTGLGRSTLSNSCLAGVFALCWFGGCGYCSQTPFCAIGYLGFLCGKGTVFCCAFVLLNCRGSLDSWIQVLCWICTPRTSSPLVWVVLSPSQATP